MVILVFLVILKGTQHKKGNKSANIYPKCLCYSAFLEKR
jgi:hypothetical protein